MSPGIYCSPIKKDVQKFLDTDNWLREYVPNKAMLTVRLTKANVRLVGKRTFEWESEEEAFQTVK